MPKTAALAAHAPAPVPFGPVPVALEALAHVRGRDVTAALAALDRMEASAIRTTFGTPTGSGLLLRWASTLLATEADIAAVPNFRRVINKALQTSRGRGAVGPQLTKTVQRDLRKAAYKLRSDVLLKRAVQEQAPDLAEALVCTGAVSWDSYAAHFVARPAVKARLLKQGQLSDAQYLRSGQRDRDTDFAIIAEQKVAFFATLPAPESLTWLQVDALVHEGKASWETWYRHQPMPAAHLAAAVHHKVFAPSWVRFDSPNRLSFVDALYQAGKLGARAATRAGIDAWQPDAPLTSFVRAQISSYKTQVGLLRHLSMPFDQSLAPRFLQRALAQWWLETPESNTKRHAGAPGGMPPAPLLGACVACGDAFDAQHTSYSMAGCTHPPTMGLMCFQAGVQAMGGQRCPDTVCHRQLSPDDILGLGLGAERADTVAQKIVSDAQAAITNWRSCLTPGCLNGAALAKGQTYQLNCKCCGRTSLLTSDITLTNDGLRDVDRHYVQRLIQDATNGGLWAHSFEGMIRECYHCGVGTQHHAGCANMHCESCFQSWNFQHGGRAYLVGTTPDPKGQAYIPHRGLLQDLGLYRGAVPGAQTPAAVVLHRNLRL